MKDKSVPDLVQTLEKKNKAYNIINAVTRILTLGCVIAMIVLSAIQTEHILNNQSNNSHALKDYIACLLTLSPTDKPSIPMQEHICFDNAPEVR
jgi:hypothetical protein